MRRKDTTAVKNNDPKTISLFDKVCNNQPAKLSTTVAFKSIISLLRLCTDVHPTLKLSHLIFFTQPPRKGLTFDSVYAVKSFDLNKSSFTRNIKILAEATLTNTTLKAARLQLSQRFIIFKKFKIQGQLFSRNTSQWLLLVLLGQQMKNQLNVFPSSIFFVIISLLTFSTLSN